MKAFYRFWNKGELTLGKSTLYILTILILLRIVSLELYPLMDTTEGRYGEMARKMAEMNDWITPWFDVGVPFWGKPPLSFWMSALGIKLFGVNEFAVRIPQFFAALLVVIISYNWAKRSQINPYYVVAILSTSFLFMLLSGAVTTDIALCVGSSLSLRGFWLSLRDTESHRRHEQWLFFIGLSIMLLAKGPVGWVLVLMPLILWASITGSIKETWKGLAWIFGCTLAILVVLPWYFIAEQHTPGFLHYFFVGEHWSRFTVPGWKGDLYGTAHARPRGSIWLDLICASFPWCLILPVVVWLTKHKNSVQEINKNQQIKLYLLLTGLAPCVFFTMSGNILWTYILPGLPSLALLLALFLGEIKPSVAKKVLFIGTSISAITMIGVFLALTLGHKADEKSAKMVVNLYKAQHSSNPLVFLNDKPFSSMFYSDGKALNVKS
jgi:4-amino-4-deoxy-L-arabinose transferase-like glycosyltransferase